MDSNKAVPPWRRKSWRKRYSDTMRLKNKAKLAAAANRGHESRKHLSLRGFKACVCGGADPSRRGCGVRDWPVRGVTDLSRRGGGYRPDPSTVSSWPWSLRDRRGAWSVPPHLRDRSVSPPLRKGSVPTSYGTDPYPMKTLGNGVFSRFGTALGKCLHCSATPMPAASCAQLQFGGVILLRAK